MFQLGKILVSEEIIQRDFVCNLSACKGACCVDGDAGAPLEKEEVAILEEIYPQVKPFLRSESIASIAEQGTSVRGRDGEWETPLIEGRECAYTLFDLKGVAQCGLEQAFNQGASPWKKPISCHMYPVRVKQYTSLTAVNYHKWQICDPACELGNELQVPVYRFVKEALIRKFGEEWYASLEEAALQHRPPE
jgi:hypothetical protein